MDQEEKAYLQRAFERLRAAALVALQDERQRAIALGTKQGLGGNTLITVGNAYTRLASDNMQKMALLAYDVTRATEGPVCEFLDHTTSSPLAGSRIDARSRYSAHLPRLTSTIAIGSQRHCTQVRLPRSNLSFQFGRASAPIIPQDVHTMRGPKDGTGG